MFVICDIYIYAVYITYDIKFVYVHVTHTTLTMSYVTCDMYIYEVCITYDIIFIYIFVTYSTLTMSTARTEAGTSPFITPGPENGGREREREGVRACLRETESVCVYN